MRIESMASGGSSLSVRYEDGNFGELALEQLEERVGFTIKTIACPTNNEVRIQNQEDDWITYILEEVNARFAPQSGKFGITKEAVEEALDWFWNNDLDKEIERPSIVTGKQIGRAHV